MSDNKTLQQNTEEAGVKDGVFSMQFLFEENCPTADKEKIAEVLEKHVGNIDVAGVNEETVHVFALDYIAEFKEGTAPVQLMIMRAMEGKPELDQLQLSQLWDCPNGREILENCKYFMATVDFLGSAMTDMKARGRLLMDLMEAMFELYPSCKAVYFPISGKMFSREAVVGDNIPKEDRFIKYAINVRFFNIEGSDEYIVDTTGMSSVFMPDLQYHFNKNIDPNMVVNHAYNLLSYIYEHNNPIEPDQTVSGIDVRTGQMEGSIQWKCQYEQALIQPMRTVIDINMTGFAAGGR